MVTDQHGNSLYGATAEAATLYDRAIGAFNVYRGDPIALLDQAIATAPRFAMAHLAKAHLLGLATEPGPARSARRILAHARTLGADERSASHIGALDLLLRGEWSGAALALDRHAARFPHDLLAIQSGHLMDFYRANARSLRDRIAHVLPHWTPQMPGYAVLLGMYAFGLEECGDYARAEDTGRAAIDREPLDCWAQHAIAHVMEMQGRAHDGVGWMRTRAADWSGDDNFFQVHNWWHLALFHLDLGEVDEVLSLYDGAIRGTRSTMALDMVDASALLWRLHLAGHDVGERWVELAGAWDEHADGKLYPFNDWHAVMAYLGAGRNGDVERIAAAFRDVARAPAETAAWAGRTGLALVEGFTAFWRGDHAGAVERLFPARHIVNAFGGSHAQRDVIDQTLIESALRGGTADLARALAHERVALKRHSPVNRAYLARAASGARPVQAVA